MKTLGNLLFLVMFVAMAFAAYFWGTEIRTVSMPGRDGVGLVHLVGLCSAGFALGAMLMYVVMRSED